MYFQKSSDLLNQTDQSDDGGIPEYFPDILKYSVRCLSANDSFHEEREDFLKKIFEQIPTRPFSDDESYFLSRGLGEYEILVIGGIDPMRMSRYLRANKAILNRVAKIAFVRKSTPPRRARLLSCGFDEVLDIIKTPVDECRARIIAVMNRYDQGKSVQRSAQEELDAMAGICKPSNLTPREFELMSVFCRHKGMTISVNNICRQIDPRDPASFKRSIKVNISNLRKKIFADYRIEADLQGAYRLYRPDSEPSST